MRSLFLIALAALAWTSTALAGPITLAVTVNTSPISGTAGSLDWNFNPGPTSSQAASVTVTGFTSSGTLAANCPCATGDVSGTLPSTLTFDNGTAFNDYFEGITFGSELSFTLHFFGPALVSPNGTVASGSTFAFSLFSDAAGTTPALTTDGLNGFALTVDVNLDGSTSITNFSSQTSVEIVTPEPGTLMIAALGLTALGLGSSRRKV